MVISLVSAATMQFSLDSPNEVYLEKEFPVSVESDSSDVFDIKIYIYQASKEYSEIYNDGWKSPNYYINEAFPEQKEFRIIAHKELEGQICLKARNSDSKKIQEVCNPINVIKSNIGTEDTKTESPSKVDEKTKAANQSIKNNNDNKVILNPKKTEVFITKNEKINIFICVAFSVISLVLIILIAFRKI